MAKTAKELAKDALAKQTARRIAKVKKRPTPLTPPMGMSAEAAPLPPTKRMSSAYDAATPLPRKSGKAKKGYSINNVMCSHTRKK